MRRIAFGAALAGALLTGLAAPVTAQQPGESLFGVTSAGITYGPYLRAELGIARADPADAHWLPPGYPNDPKVYFDLDIDTPALGGVAVGFDRMDGFRAELAFWVIGSRAVEGDWFRTEPPTPGPHARIETEVSSTVLMANGYFSPLEAMGRNVRVQPFLTAGIGLASSEMEDWTRFNPASGRPERRFAGSSGTDFAWSVGAGVSAEIGRVRGRPLILEATYRYMDLGTVRGSRSPLPGEGNGRPVRAFGFDNRQHVATIGLRIPLQAY